MLVTHATPLAILRLAATDPAGGTRAALALGLPVGVLWQAFALVVVCSVLLSEVATRIMPGSGAMLDILAVNPLLAGTVQAILLFIMVHAVHRIGARFGGQGDLEGALTVVVLVQALLLGLQVLQVAALLLFPVLAALIGLFGLVYFLWVLTTAVTVLHGFSSRGKVFGGIVLSFLAIVFALSFLLALFGVTIAPPGA